MASSAMQPDLDDIPQSLKEALPKGRLRRFAKYGGSHANAGARSKVEREEPECRF